METKTGVGTGRLILIPTPIGNLGDITHRAIETLKNVDLVACEDTRRALTLFQHYAISTPRVSFHAHNEHAKYPSLVSKMQAGATVGLVTDAGSPGISDPGFLLVRECVRANITVEALPGATAFVPALTTSGFPSDRFVFEGFLPPRKGRVSRLERLAAEKRTVILYESPHRIIKLLRQIEDIMGPERYIAVARELTKKFEEIVRGTVSNVRVDFESRSKIKGELVVVLSGIDFSPPVDL